MGTSHARLVNPRSACPGDVYSPVGSWLFNEPNLRLQVGVCKTNREGLKPKPKVVVQVHGVTRSSAARQRPCHSHGSGTEEHPKERPLSPGSLLRPLFPPETHDLARNLPIWALPGKHRESWVSQWRKDTPPPPRVDLCASPDVSGPEAPSAPPWDTAPIASPLRPPGVRLSSRDTCEETPHLPGALIPFW